MQIMRQTEHPLVAAISNAAISDHGEDGRDEGHEQF